MDRDPMARLARLLEKLPLPRAAMPPELRRPPGLRLAWWLPGEWALELRSRLRERGARPVTVSGVACAALRFEEHPALVPPATWGQRCARQCSWIAGSDKEGQWLAVSAEPIEELDGLAPIRISPTHFTPPRECGPDELPFLVNDPAYMARKPEAWNRVTPEERRKYLRQALAFGRPTLDFERILLMAGANHANFLSPRLVALNEGGEGDEGLAVPYSIAPSAYLCSCCMELFGVLAPPSRKMLVRPCPGAVRFAGLAPDAYLRVELPPK